MKALSLWRPWPRAILELGKRLENRSDVRGMPPMMRYRGPLLLHAAKPIDRDTREWIRVLFPEHREALGSNWWVGEDGPTGIVGTCDVVGAVDPFSRFSGLQPVGLDMRWWMGGWALILANVRQLHEPVPCAGHQGLWTPPPDVLAAVHRQTAAGRFAECRP